VEQDGQVTYQEAKEDDNPIKIQLDRAYAHEMFDLAEKLGRFQRPVESGLKIANLGLKTFRFEDGAEHHEIQFNYSQDINAQMLLDLLRAHHRNRTALRESGPHRAFRKAGRERRAAPNAGHLGAIRLVAPEQFLPLLDRIAKNESYLHISRELAAAIADAIRKPPSQEKAQ
jgi:hypothetical protein